MTKTTIGIHAASTKSDLYNSKNLDERIKAEITSIIKDLGISVKEHNHLFDGRGAGGVGFLYMVYDFLFSLYRDHLSWLAAFRAGLTLVKTVKVAAVWSTSVAFFFSNLYQRHILRVDYGSSEHGTRVSLEIISREDYSTQEWRYASISIIEDLVPLIYHIQSRMYKTMPIIKMDFNVTIISKRAKAPTFFGIIDLMNLNFDIDQVSDLKEQIKKVKHDKREKWITGITRYKTLRKGKMRYRVLTSEIHEED